MPKRFADTKLFDQSWFLDLSFESKMIWIFLERSCDHAGIWEIDIPQMRRKLGCSSLKLVEFMEEVNMDYSKSTGEPLVVNRVLAVCNNTKLWMTGFIADQYEKGLHGINPAVPAIKSVINRLKDEGIYEFALKEGFVRIQKINTDANETLSLELNDGPDLNNVTDLNKVAEVNNRTELNPAADSNVANANVPDSCNANNEFLTTEDNLNKTEEALSDKESNPINIPEAKGSEPFERDKDKDKDKDSSSNSFILKEIGGMGERTKNECNTSLVRSLFDTHWGKNPYTPHEEALTAQLIMDYGIDEVQTAFGEAVNHNKPTLAYIKGILKKRSVKLELQKAEELKKAELHRIANKATEERRQGIKLNLVESVYGSR